jgi:cation diffusion facilitator CzcD-associated flavoprotein CzcO
MADVSAANGTGRPTEHLDVLIVGAGLSGIGAAHHLQRELPEKRYAILEARSAIGGTWDLFRYPGLRSDSDLHTYAYAFKPWTDERAIAGGDAILRYIRETAREDGSEQRIRYSHRVTAIEWSSAEARWHVDVLRTDTGEQISLSCSWIFCASGYYRYEAGYQPRFPGAERFAGQIVHPQHWPEDLDYAGKRVVVIGSGATAVTLVPAIAGEAAHVTMLQRSPTYIVSVPERDAIANLLRRLLPAERAYALTRRKNIWLQKSFYNLSQSRPGLVKKLLRRGLEKNLPAGYDIDRHFTPAYNPWEQRLCAVPDGDLFAAISSGGASIVTDRITGFTETGIALESGAELEADIIVTATGLDLVALGGIEITVDEQPVRLPEKLVYKSAMVSDIPNLMFVFGYTNASWTLKLDLVCEWACGVISYMDRRGYDTCIPVNTEESLPTRPFLDFGAGYVKRSVASFPRQGTDGPWQVKMSYAQDVRVLREGAIDDGILEFSGPLQRLTAPMAATPTPV